LEDAADQIAVLLYPIVVHYQNEPLETMKTYLRRIAYDMCRQMEQFCVPHVSQAAYDEATSKGIANLHTWRWRDQSRQDRGREVFHLEHKMPVALMRDHVLKARSVKEVAATLKSASIAWILKRENSRLEELGFRSRRDDPDDAYRQADIKLRPLDTVP
jgi:hypothetical protein